MMLKD